MLTLFYIPFYDNRAKENIHLAQPPELATVTEDEEGAAETAAAAPVAVTPRTVVEKDEHGKTQLHHLVGYLSVILV